MELKRGQKVDITKNNPTETFRFHTKWQQPKKEMDLDISAFLLHAGDRCMKDDHFIFYGQPESNDRSVRHESVGPNEGVIDIAFSNIPADVEKIALALTIHEGDEQDLRFREIEEARLFIKDGRTSEVLHEFSFKGNLEQETAIVIGELYRHNEEWKFNAVGSGFFGGLTALCKNFGLQVADDGDQQPAPMPEQSNMEELLVPAMSVEEERSSLTLTDQQQVQPTKSSLNVTLEKNRSVSIQKSPKVVVTLEWANKKKDLDLYCFYVLQTGEVGKVYYRHVGSSSVAPYITLEGDAKISGVEKIVIHQPSKLKYVLFASYKPLSSGAYGFRKIETKVVVNNQVDQQVTAVLDENNLYAYWAAIAHLDFTKATEIVVSQVERYSRPGSEKSPVLNEDGTFKMDKGAIEFK